MPPAITTPRGRCQREPGIALRGFSMVNPSLRKLIAAICSFTLRR
jgi:hypothetical protein